MKYLNPLFTLLFIVSLSLPAYTMRGDEESENHVSHTLSIIPINQDQQNEAENSSLLKTGIISQKISYSLLLCSQFLLKECIGWLDAFFNGPTCLEPLLSMEEYFDTDECLLHIFQYLSIEDLGRVAQVSKRFQKISEDDFLWTNPLRELGARMENIEKKEYKKTFKRLEWFKMRANNNMQYGYGWSEDELNLAMNTNISPDDLLHLKQAYSQEELTVDFIRSLKKNVVRLSFPLYRIKEDGTKVQDGYVRDYEPFKYLRTKTDE